MNCTEFQTEWAALEDSSRLTATMEGHRRGCVSCSELLEDLNSIIEQARAMRLNEEPPQRVWAAIHNQLEQEALMRKPVLAQAGPRWRNAPVTGWLFRRPMGLAYTAVFFLAVGVMYLHSIISSPVAPPMLATSPQVPSTTITETAARDKSFQEMVAKMPEDHRATFETNWHQVNSAVADLSSFVNDHPEDPLAREQLINAFQQRERLWETLVRWDEF